MTANNKRKQQPIQQATNINAVLVALMSNRKIRRDFKDIFSINFVMTLAISWPPLLRTIRGAWGTIFDTHERNRDVTLDNLDLLVSDASSASAMTGKGMQRLTFRSWSS